MTTPSKKPFILIALLAVFLVAGNWYGSRLTSTTVDTEIRLNQAKAAVLEFARDTGAVPKGFEDLVAAGLLEAIPTNRAGHALVYTVKDDGMIEIKSLGPDGKEGGRWFKADQAITFELEPQP